MDDYYRFRYEVQRRIPMDLEAYRKLTKLSDDLRVEISRLWPQRLIDPDVRQENVRSENNMPSHKHHLEAEDPETEVFEVALFTPAATRMIPYIRSLFRLEYRLLMFFQTLPEKEQDGLRNSANEFENTMRALASERNAAYEAIRSIRGMKTALKHSPIRRSRVAEMLTVCSPSLSESAVSALIAYDNLTHARKVAFYNGYLDNYTTKEPQAAFLSPFRHAIGDVKRAFKRVLG